MGRSNTLLAITAAVAVTMTFLMGLSPVAVAREKETRISVSNYGAIPNDGEDDTKAVLAALEQCKKETRSTLLFPKGRYDFFAGNNPQDKGTLFPITNIDNLTIDGQGSDFMIHGLTGVFTFTSCKNLTIRGLVIDWDRPFYSAGKVIAVEHNYFDVEVFPRYPVKGGELVGAYMDYDPETKLPMHRGVDQYNTCTKTELVKEQVLRVHTSNRPPIKSGVIVVLRHQVYGPGTFRCSRCSDVKVQNVTVYHAPGMGFVGNICTNITMERFRVIPKPGSANLMSTTADATHFGGCKGVIRMDRCEYEGMGDDGVNIKSGLYLSLKKTIDDHTIVGQHNLQMMDAPDPGDEMEISHVDDLIPYAKCKVKKVDVLKEQKSVSVEFEAPLPDQLKEGDVFGNATRAPKVRIKNTEVRKNRARGMLIQTRDAVIENCRFTRCTGSGIMVLTEVTHFFESIGTRNVTVRNCTFDHCNYGAATGPGALSAFAWLKDHRYPSKPGVHRDIVFEDNTIRGTNNTGIFVAGVDGVVISNNTIEPSEAPTKDNRTTAINVTSSRGIHIKGNKVNPNKQGTEFKQALRIADNVDKSTVKVVDNKGF